jgi:predicted transcriptional regulator
MKILTRTTTIRLQPNIYEQVIKVAHEKRQHPTALMRQAIIEYVREKITKRREGTVYADEQHARAEQTVETQSATRVAKKRLPDE